MALTRRRTGARTLVTATCLAMLGVAGASSLPVWAESDVEQDCAYQLSVPPPNNPKPIPPNQRRISEMGEVLGGDGGDRFAGWRFWSQGNRTGYVGAIWSGDTELYLEGTETDNVAKAYDVNRNGDAVGTMRAGAGSDHATLWKAGAPATPIRLAEPAGATQTTAEAINDSGLIVGYATFGTGSAATMRGLTWSVASPAAVRDLGTGAGLLSDVDATGRMVGFTGRASAPVTAVAGTVQGLSPLPGQTQASGGYALTLAGRFIAGRAAVAGGGTGPVIWEDGTPRALPALAPGPSALNGQPVPPAPAFPTAVNSAGLVVADTGDVRLGRGVGGTIRGSYLDGAGQWQALPMHPADPYESTSAFAVAGDGRIGGAIGAADGVSPAFWTCQ